MNSEFMFRENYSPEDKEQRINAEYLTWDVPIFRRGCEEAGLSQEDLGNRREILSSLERALGGERYRQFLDDMFEEYGKRGQQFNFQLFSVSDNISLSDLQSHANDLREEWLNEELEGFPHEVKLVNQKYSNDGQSYDLLFLGKGYPDSDSAAEFQLSQDGEQHDLSEVEGIAEDAHLVKPSEYYCQVRIYQEGGIIAISRSDTSKNLRESINKVVTDWGESE